MSKDEFVLKINKVKVDLTNVSGGIKREDIIDEKMQNIFDAVDTDKNQVLSDEEVNAFFGMVKKEAQKHNSKNLGNREYKKLLKQLEENGIKIENTDKKTFLQFLSDLKNVGEKSAEAEAAEQTEPSEEPKKSEKAEVRTQTEEASEKRQETVRRKKHSAGKTTSVVVQLGETPEMLAKKFGCSVREIKALNKSKLMKNGKWFRAGDTIVLPKEIATEQLKGRKSSEEVNNEYREMMANRQAARESVQEDNVNSDAAVKGNDESSQTTGSAEGAKKEPAASSKVKLNVPVTDHSVRTKQIHKYREQGQKLTDSLKNNDLKGLARTNIAYAFTSEVKFQNMTEETLHFVFKNLVQRLIDLKEFESGKDYGNYNSFKKLSKNQQNKILREYRNRIVVHENKEVRSDNARVAKANAERPKLQKVYEEANKFIDNAAKGKVKPAKIDVGTSNKAAKFEDGKKIEVFYDSDGTINSVNVFNKEPDDDNVKAPDVRYTADGVNVKNEHSKNTIKSGFDFEKIKANAEKIFGKYNADDFKAKDVSEEEEADAAGEAPSTEETQAPEETPAGKTSQPAEETPAPEAEPKFTTDQIKTTVKYQHYSPTQIQRHRDEGKKIAKGKLDWNKVNTGNIAYYVREVKGNIALSLYAKQIFDALISRMVTLNIWDGKNDYGAYSMVSKLPKNEQNEIFRQYAERISQAEDKRLNAPKEAAKQQKVFDEANKFLVDMANDSHGAAKIEWLNDEHTILSAKLFNGTGVYAKFDDKGEITQIKINYHDNLKQIDVSYDSEVALVNTDTNNDTFEGELTSGYDFNEIKKVAETIFADFLKKNE